MKAEAGRRAASVLLASVLAHARLPAQTPAHALEVRVQERTEQQQLEQALYSNRPEVKSYQQQVGEAITIRSLKGVWTLRETRAGVTTSGRMTFRGAESEGKGTVTYDGEAAAGRGPWILKPDGFGRGSVGGVIEQKGLWKLRRGAEGTFTFAARVNVANPGATNLDATIEGDIVELVNGGKPKGGTERKVGTFAARFERPLLPAEETAASASAMPSDGEGALQMTCVAASGVLSTDVTPCAAGL